jgi:hypothetical protein
MAVTRALTLETMRSLLDRPDFYIRCPLFFGLRALAGIQGDAGPRAFVREARAARELDPSLLVPLRRYLQEVVGHPGPWRLQARLGRELVVVEF